MSENMKVVSTAIIGLLVVISFYFYCKNLQESADYPVVFTFVGSTTVNSREPTTSIITTSPIITGTYPIVPGKYDYTAKDVISLINKVRAAAGVAPLTETSDLDAAAQEHATYINATKDFSHQTNEGAFSNYISNQNWIIAGENLAENYRSLPDLVSNWLVSRTHRENILNPIFTKTGAAVADPYVVQIFTD